MTGIYEENESSILKIYGIWNYEQNKLDKQPLRQKRNSSQNFRTERQKEKCRNKH
jgi:hypothetical protein